MANMLIAHGGAPTAVLNSSLYGVIEEARRSNKIERLYGAIGGDAGIMEEKFLDLLTFSESETRKLLFTPASSLGTSRYIHQDDDWEKMAAIFEKYDIRYVLMQGGNGTMNTCGNLVKACAHTGVTVVGLPKTIDNDLAQIDHAPGYASTARFVAAAVGQLACDVEALPIHVSVIETMGRNAGWIAGASALARREAGDAPDLIYLPERRFHMDHFLEDVERIHRDKGGVVVVCSEGLRGMDGELLVPPVFEMGRAVYPSYAGMHLAEQVTKQLGIKARYEKPGLYERTSIPWQSEVDRQEAVEVGRLAVRKALEGKTGVMIGIKRLSTAPYRIEYVDIPVDQVMMTERLVPDEWINDRGNDVTREFVDWCRPLVGDGLGEYLRFNRIYRATNH